MRFGYLGVIAGAAIGVSAGAARAAPPPPPPQFIADAAGILAEPKKADAIALDDLIAEDVVVYANGAIVSQGKAAWRTDHTAELAHDFGRTLAFVEGRDSVMFFDTFDTIASFEPRMTTRSILYQFGDDHLIYAIRRLAVASFVIIPPSSTPEPPNH